MQLIAGLSKTVYWIGNLVFDFLFMVIIMLFSCILIYFYDEFGFFSSNFPMLFLTLILASFNCLLITYFIVNLNVKRELTDILVKWPLIIAGTVCGIYDVIQTLIKTYEPGNFPVPSKDKITVPYSFLLKIVSPPYNVLDTIFQLLNLSITKACREFKMPSELCDSFDSKAYDFAENILAYFLSFILFGALIVLVNYYHNQLARFLESYKAKKDQNKQTDASQTQIAHLSKLDTDPNIDREKELTQLVIETNQLSDNKLVVYDLYKLFGSFKAVNHVHFTVKNEECFGLLGINGAGKTTTFKMIGGSLMRTSGLIKLDGYNFENSPYEYFRRLGYCPQENTHTKRITVIDNLMFYARINGVPNGLIDKTVKTLIEECDLEEHKFKFADKLSGGNMRKLSTAISLIGKKDLILLGKQFLFF